MKHSNHKMPSGKKMPDKKMPHGPKGGGKGKKGQKRGY